MTHRIIDISSNNTHPIDFAAVKASGVDTVFIKATEGTTYVNPDYAADRDAARAAGLAVAAYHYADFTDATAEANHFRAVAGSDAKILDGETTTNAAWLNQFLTALGQPSDQELTYGSASTIPSSGITRGFLWPAAWGPNDPRIPNEVAWQDSDAGTLPGIQGRVDTSEWTGSEAAYQTFIGATPAPPAPAPTPPPPPVVPPYPGHPLTIGTTGPNVVLWQERMKARGWDIGRTPSSRYGGIDGEFGPKCQQLAHDFEVDQHLTIDAGIVGPQVWHATWANPITP